MLNKVKNQLLSLLGIKEVYQSSRKKLRDYSLDLNKSHPGENFTNSITVVIPSLNRLKVLKLTINYLKSYKTNLNLKFIIIDNNSNEETQNYLRELKKDNKFNIINLDKNLGGSGSREEALKYVQTEFVCFLDNDILVMPFYFENLLKSLKDNPDVYAVQSKVILPNLKIQINKPDFKIENGWIIFDDIDDGKEFNDDSTLSAQNLKWIPVGATMWRTDILKKFPLDSNFATSFEDNDLTYRMHINGARFINCPSALCLHLNSQFTPSSVDKVYSQGRFGNENVQNSAKLFYKKHKLYFASGDIEGFSKHIGFKDSKEYVEFLNT